MIASIFNDAKKIQVKQYPSCGLKKIILSMVFNTQEFDDNIVKTRNDGDYLLKQSIS